MPCPGALSSEDGPSSLPENTTATGIRVGGGRVASEGGPVCKDPADRQSNLPIL